MHRQGILSRQSSGQNLPDLSLTFASDVANGLLKVPEVQSVELFGSIARDKRGNDLCFLLVTDMEIFEKFANQHVNFQNALSLLGYSTEEIRRMVIASIWNIHAPEWVEIQAFYQSDVHTDICVVPQGWREWWASTWLPQVYNDDFIDMLRNEAIPIATRRM